MLHHVSIGVADVTRSAAFYDAVLGALGYGRVLEFLPHAVSYGEGSSELWVQLPHDQKTASVGNGAHIGFKAKTREAVHAFHAAALAGGGTDDGAPGPREDYGPTYYGAFVRDLDGNKLEAMLVPETKPAAKAGRAAKAKVAKPKAKAAKPKAKAAAKAKPKAKAKAKPAAKAKPKTRAAKRKAR